MSDLVTVLFETDPDAIEASAIESLQTSIPGWTPRDGALEVWVIAAVARMVAELTTVASSVPVAVLRAFGTQLIGLPPLAGTVATMSTTWTARDNAGHVIPAGTQVGYRVSGDTLLLFEVIADATIPAGTTSLSPVAVQHLESGVVGNGVPVGALELVDSLSWVSSVAAATVSAGGVDAETDDEYTSRLIAELRLLAPRPILPEDFGVLARRVTGVARALAVDGYDPGVNEMQAVATTGVPTGGTFTLTYSGQTTSAIAYNASAATIQAALEALSNIAVGDVACTGGPLPAAVKVEFTGALAVTNVALMTHTDSLTGGSTPAVTVTTTQGGVAPSSGNERMVCVFPVDAAGVACSSVIRAAVQSYLDGMREVSFSVKVSTPSYTTVNVVFTVRVAAGFDPATVIAACTAAATAYLTPGNWAGGADSPPVWRSGETVVRYLALSAVLAAVNGVAYVATLTLNSATTDVTLTGTAPLPTAGTVTGSAV